MSATADLLKRREDWFGVKVVANQRGGYDVALVLDGSYDKMADALRNADSFKRQLEEALAADGLPYGVPWSLCPGQALEKEPLPGLPVQEREELP